MEYHLVKILAKWLRDRAVPGKSCNHEYYRALVNAADSLEALLKFW